MEKNAVLQSPTRIEELVKIFIHATKVRGLIAGTNGMIFINSGTDGDRILGNVSVGLTSCEARLIDLG